MNIYLKKYIKYKKKYYKIKYGGKIENNSIEIFRCYLDILLYKLDIEDKDWSIIRNSNEYKDIKQKYKETTKEPSKHNGFFNNLYDKTPFYKSINIFDIEEQSYVTIIYDKYIRVGNENVCMPHGIKLFEVCKENKEFYKWYDPNDPDNKTLSQVEIGKNIGTKKISSYLKIQSQYENIQSQYENFNSLSKIKYIIERCLFNPDYTDKDKIKAIIVPLSVNTLYEEKEIQSECTRYTNHANMFLIKINRPKDNDKTTADYVKKVEDNVKKAADNVKKAADNLKKAADDVKKAADDDKKAADDIKKAADNVKKTADDIKKAAHDVKKAADDVKKAEAKIKLELQYFDPNGKQSLYLKKRFEKYAEEINKVSEDKYVITGVKELDFDINNSAIKGQKSAIHKIFPNKWIDGGICGSITWIIFILWVKVCSVVKDFDDFYNDIINILFIQSWQDWVIFENSQLDQYEKNHYLNLIDSKINVEKKKKIKECYIDFLYIIYKFLDYMALEKFEEYEEIKELYNLRKNEIKQYKLIETYQKIMSQREYTKIEKEINKKFRDEYEKKINYLVKSNNKKIKKKLEELKKLKENNNIGTIGSIINIFKSIGKNLSTNFPVSFM